MHIMLSFISTCLMIESRAQFSVLLDITYDSIRVNLNWQGSVCLRLLCLVATLNKISLSLSLSLSLARSFAPSRFFGCDPVWQDEMACYDEHCFPHTNVRKSRICGNPYFLKSWNAPQNSMIRRSSHVEPPNDSCADEQATNSLLCTVAFLLHFGADHRALGDLAWVYVDVICRCFCVPRRPQDKITACGASSLDSAPIL